MKLILFGTSACHLCEIAFELVTRVLQNYPHIQLELIDIAEQMQWQQRYAVRIPVLFAPESLQELGWIFDENTLMTFIHELENDRTI